MNKVIFLDIDGVLNTLDQKIYGPGTRGAGYARLIDPAMVGHLNRIIDETQAGLVISSSWRNLVHSGHMDLYGFGALLRSHGVHGSLWGITEDNPLDDPRRHQIFNWLQDHRDYFERYIVIDDDPDAALNPARFIQTDSMIGLTQEQADQAIEILGSAHIPA